MKRTPIVLGGTALGLAGVLGYHASTPASLAGTASRTATTASTTSSSSSSSSQTRSATGQDVSFQYGDLQLKVTVSGKRVTNVSVAQLNVTDPHSQSIDESAIPQLNQQAVAAGSASIDGVSGASYTSQAYKQSLQSALDKLGTTTTSAQ